MTDFPSKFADSSQSTGFLFIQAYNNWHTELKRQLKTIDLTHPQFVVLTTLGYLQKAHEEVQQVSIANAADMDVMTVSQVLTLLERKELVVREASKTDTRAKAIALTGKGRELLKLALPMVEQVDELYFGQLHNTKAAFNEALRLLAGYRFDGESGR